MTYLHPSMASPHSFDTVPDVYRDQCGPNMDTTKRPTLTSGLTFFGERRFDPWVEIGFRRETLQKTKPKGCCQLQHVDKPATVVQQLLALGACFGLCLSAAISLFCDYI